MTKQNKILIGSSLTLSGIYLNKLKRIEVNNEHMLLFVSVKCLGRCVEEIFLLRFCFQVLVIWLPIFVRVNLVEQSQRDRIVLKTAHMFIFLSMSETRKSE